MSDWTSGYVADIDYTYGYYTELNPLRVKLAFLNSGLVSPEIGSACELGFGLRFICQSSCRRFFCPVARYRFQSQSGGLCSGTRYRFRVRCQALR